MIDSHCHIHSEDYGLDAEEVIKNAAFAGIDKIVCIGSDIEDSRTAIKFANAHKNCWASIGLHPHDANQGQPALNELSNLLKSAASTHKSQPRKVVAIGECGLDYHYMNSTKAEQDKALRYQIELAIDNNLPLVFHVREAFEDFFSIIDDYSGIKGVVHSFTAGRKELDKVLSHGLLVGINGIVTFTKDRGELEAAKAIPLNSLLLETDAPFLTPAPFRGKVNEPKQILQIAKFLSGLRGESLQELAKATTQNAEKLYNI